MPNEFKTLADRAKETDPSGNALTIVEYIAGTNELDDIPSEPSMTDTDIIGVRRTGLPAVTRRKINEGVQNSKSKTTPFRDSAILYEAHGMIDAELVDEATDKATVRLNENKGHMQALGEIFAEDLFYGKIKDGAFDGFLSYLDKLSNSNVVDGGGTTNLASIVFVGWAPDTVTTFYPKNTKAGINHEAMGRTLIKAPSGVGDMLAYPDIFKWKVGLTVKNPKFVSRIANIDVENVNYQNLFRAMIKAKNKLPSLNVVRPRIYCNETIYTALETAAFEKANAMLTYREVQNSTPVLSFGTCQIKRIDKLTCNEDRVA